MADAALSDPLRPAEPVTGMPHEASTGVHTELAGWSLTASGLPWWLMVPLAVLAAVAVARLYRAEAAVLPLPVRRWVVGLRATTVALVVLMLAAPTITRFGEQVDVPEVVILLDDSQSMAVVDANSTLSQQLDDAAALGLISGDRRDISVQHAADHIDQVLTKLPRWLMTWQGAATSGAEPEAAASSQLTAALVEPIQHYATKLSGHPQLSTELQALHDDLQQLRVALSSPIAADLSRVAEGSTLDLSPSLPSDLAQWPARGRQLIAQLRAIQAAADASLVNALGRDDVMRLGLDQLRQYSRWQRARMLVEQIVVPGLAGHATLSVRRLSDGVNPLRDHPGGLLGGSDSDSGGGDGDGDGDSGPVADRTDPSAALRAVAESAGERRLGAVLLVGDGRTTSGDDAAVRATVLAARQSPVSAITVGHRHAVRDAAIDRISGPREVVLDEPIPLEIRYRIVGFDQQPWVMTVAVDGQPVSRHVVSGGAQAESQLPSAWQTLSVSVPAESPGLQHISAQLQPLTVEGAVAEGEAGLEPREGSIDQRRRAGMPSGLWWQRWDDVPGESVSVLDQILASQRQADRQQLLGRAEVPIANSHAGGKDYVSLLSGWLLPERTGAYRFAVAADDQAELWLASDHQSSTLTRIAMTSNRTKPLEWDDHRSQRSSLIELNAHQPYRIEMRHKQHKNKQHAAIAWQPPSSQGWTIIPGRCLVPATAAIDQMLIEAPASTEPAAARASSAADQAATDSTTAADPPALEAITANNQAQYSVLVHQDTVRVLLLDALPRWDSRYLVSLFARDSRVEVTRRFRFIELGRAAQGLDIDDFLPPTQQQLDAYDMVVLGDLRPSELPHEDQQRLADYVAERGGFVVFLAGPRALPHQYLETAQAAQTADRVPAPLASLLPVIGSGSLATQPVPSRMHITPAGRQHPITQILSDSTINQQMWSALPPLDWVATGLRRKPGAQVLLESAPQAGQALAPVVVVQRYGAGRVAYVGSDQTWRWRDRLGDRVHQAFWLHMQRWGLSERLRGADPRLQVSLDRIRMAPADSAELRARVVDASGQPLSTAPALTVVRLDANGQAQPATAQRIQLIADGSVPGLWQQQISDLDPGRWQLTVAVDEPALGSLNDLSERRVLVVERPASAETKVLEPDFANLERLTSAGQGEAVMLADAAGLVERIAAQLQPQRRPVRTTTRLWSSYWTIIIVVGLLLAEWLLRKRHGLA